MGALVTLQLADGSPLLAMPWIITFGPLTDEEDWEPVVCGPYEHPHALALAEEIVADEELMAVVEPLMGFASPDQIRAEIEVAKAAADRGPDDYDNFDDLDDEFAPEPLDGVLDGDGAADPGGDAGVDEHPAMPLPPAAEIRAGMARIARRLGEQP